MQTGRVPSGERMGPFGTREIVALIALWKVREYKCAGRLECMRPKSLFTPGSGSDASMKGLH